MKEMEEEDEREQNELRAQISRLEGGVKNYERMVQDFCERMKVLEEQLFEERNARTEVQRDLARYRGEDIPLDVVPLAPRRKPLDVQQPVPEVHINEAPANEALLGCGNCTINTRCECFERAVDAANYSVENTGSAAKRPHSPFQYEHEQNKRPRYSQNDDVKPENEMEIDFTTRYATQSSTAAVPLRPTVTTMQGFEGCGFCQDGTACLCAELAEDAKSSAAVASNFPQIPSVPAVTGTSYTTANMPASPPPPYPFHLMSLASVNPCANGPGTCKQCQSSPTSTLFCKSLAATRCDLGRTAEQPPIPYMPASSAPCGKLSGCCRTQDSEPIVLKAPRSHTNPLVVPQPPSSFSVKPIQGPTLSCADAYITLQRHPGWDRAGTELGAWLPKLATVTRGLEGRTAFEIEAASVMGVLKYFDRRFGRGG